MKNITQRFGPPKQGDLVRGIGGIIGIYVGTTKSGSIWICWDHSKYDAMKLRIAPFQ